MTFIFAMKGLGSDNPVWKDPYFVAIYDHKMELDF